MAGPCSSSAAQGISPIQSCLYSVLPPSPSRNAAHAFWATRTSGSWGQPPPSYAKWHPLR
eukprot:2228167-Pyramimonas_sp.AAC.1